MDLCELCSWQCVKGCIQLAGSAKWLLRVTYITRYVTLNVAFVSNVRDQVRRYMFKIGNITQRYVTLISNTLLSNEII